MDIDYHRTSLINGVVGPIDMVERTLAVLICACITITGMLLLASWYREETFLKVSPSDVDGLAPGTSVEVEGTIVERFEPSGYRFTVLQLEDDLGARVKVFCAFVATDLVVGDEIRVRGIVSLYEGETEVVIDSPLHIKVLSTGPLRDLTSLGAILAEPWSFAEKEPLVPVEVSTWPVPDQDQGVMWCLVTEPDTVKGALVFVRFGSDEVPAELEPGTRMDLRVAVRYDPSAGFVYLEVLGTV